MEGNPGKKNRGIHRKFQEDDVCLGLKIGQKNLRSEMFWVFAILFPWVVCKNLDLPRSAEWLIRRAEKQHPLGFKHHPNGKYVFYVLFW